MPFLLDTPATWTAFNHFMVFKQVHELGARVCMSGEGADELFGGYARYRILYHAAQMYNDPVLKTTYRPMIEQTVGTLSRLYLKITNRSAKPWEFFGGIEEQYRRVFEHEATYINAIGKIDFDTSMQVLLQMPDRVGLFHQVESRAPFLDPRLIAFSRSLPEHLKIDANESKVLMRKIAKILIPQYKAEAFKKGFGVPYNHWYGSGGYERSGFRDEYMALWRDCFKNWACFNAALQRFQNELE